jgi:NADPH-dependent 2,4-dienoyl-CoA reductase/sulfur reductase-like enzyme
MERMLAEEEVSVFVNSQVLEIKKGVVVLKEGDHVRELKTDLVVVSVGMKTNPGGISALKNACAVSYVIGDALEPHTIREAVYEGDRIGRLI